MIADPSFHRLFPTVQKYLSLWLCLMFFGGTNSACTTIQGAQLHEQLESLEERGSRKPQDWAFLGWWRYLSGDPNGARIAFEKSGSTSLASLGRARLALDRLDHRAAFREASQAAKGDGIEGWVGRQWAEREAEALVGARNLLAQQWNPSPPHARTPVASRTYGPVSFLPHLDLAYLAETPPSISAGGDVIALNSSWKETSRAIDPDGLYLTVFELDSAPHHLELKTPRVGRIFLNESPTKTIGISNSAPSTMALQTQGEKTLIIAWSDGRAPMLFKASSPHPTYDGTYQGPAVRDRAPTTNWVIRYLHIEKALLMGDFEAARTLLSGVPEVPAFEYLKARLALLTPHLDQRYRWSRFREALAYIGGFAPNLKTFELARAARVLGEHVKASALLESLPAKPRKGFPTLSTLTTLYAAQGRNILAQQTLEKALLLAPSRCVLLEPRRQYSSINGDALKSLIRDHVDCNSTLEIVRWLNERGLWEKALNTLFSGIKPDQKGKHGEELRPALRFEWARALVASNDVVKAASVLRGVDEPRAGRLVADLESAMTPDKMPMSLFEYISKNLDQRSALELAQLNLKWTPFGLTATQEPTRRAVEKTIEKYPTAPAIRVHEHNVVFYPGGQNAVRWVREILALQTKEAVETYGEVGLPEDALPIRLHNRKQNGMTLPAEYLPETESYSYPDLEVGDWVVAEYLDPLSNEALIPSGILSPRILFQGFDMPTVEQIFEVYAKKGPQLVWTSRGAAPTPTAVQVGHFEGLRFKRRGAKMAIAEPHSVEAEDVLPSVRTGRGIDLGESIKILRNQVLAFRQGSPRLREWVAAKAGSGAPEAQMRNVIEGIRQEIEPYGGMTTRHVSKAIDQGMGNRAQALSVALEILGVAHQLLLVQPSARLPEGRLTTAFQFGYPVIRLQDGRIIDPNHPRAQDGFVPFPYLGGKAIIAWPALAPLNVVDLPKKTKVDESRRIEAHLHLKATGVITGEVLETISGQEAIVISEAFRKANESQQRQLAGQLMAGVCGGSEVTEVNQLRGPGPKTPLTLRYIFTCKAENRFTLGVFPREPGRKYASLARRKTPVVVRIPLHQEVVLSLASEMPIDVRGKTGEWHIGQDRFSMKISGSDREFTLESTLDLPGGRRSPNDYAPFAEWARQTDDLERIEIRVKSSDEG